MKSIVFNKYTFIIMYEVVPGSIHLLTIKPIKLFSRKIAYVVCYFACLIINSRHIYEKLHISHLNFI